MYGPHCAFVHGQVNYKSEHMRCPTLGPDPFSAFPTFLIFRFTRRIEVYWKVITTQVVDDDWILPDRRLTTTFCLLAEFTADVVTEMEKWTGEHCSLILQKLSHFHVSEASGSSTYS